MSKKRKTRKQKEAISRRNINELPEHVHHIHKEASTYSIEEIKHELPKIQREITIPTESGAKLKDAAYLQHDMVAISAASGIVAAFDILLFALLATGFIHLRLLGY